MPIVTAQDLISFTLRQCGALGVGQTALAQDSGDAMSALNGMISLWNRRRWLIPNLLDLAVLSTGAQSYSLGAGGDFNTTRTDRLEAAYFRQYINAPTMAGNELLLDEVGGPLLLDGIGTSSGLSTEYSVDYPLQILESREDYSTIALKTLVSWPTYVFYDSAYPLGFVYPWPIPQASLYELHIIVKSTLAPFTSFTQAINLPPEYIEPLWTNLALRLATIYGFQPNPGIISLAKGATETLRATNTQIPRLDMPAGLCSKSKYNIFSDAPYS